MSIPSGGGDWSRDQKRRTIDIVKGLLRDQTEPVLTTEDLGRYGGASELETLLSNAIIEQQMFDCKQGLHALDASRSFDENAFEKIEKTLAAMSNAGPGARGYVLLGIADDAADSARIAQLDIITPSIFRGFYIVGIERESGIRGTTLNDYWAWIIQRLTNGKLDRALSSQVAADSRFINYNGKAVAMLRVTGRAQPTFYENALYERSGSSTVTVPPGNDYMRIFSRF